MVTTTVIQQVIWMAARVAVLHTIYHQGVVELLIKAQMVVDHKRQTHTWALLVVVMEEVVEVELVLLQMVDQEVLVEEVQTVVLLLQEQDLEDQEFNLLNLEIQELMDLVILEEMLLHPLVEVQVVVVEQKLQVLMQQFQILEMVELVNR